MNPNINSTYWTHFITIFDFVLLPMYLMVVFFIAMRICNKKYPTGHPWRKYFIYGFSLKILGAIFIGLVYEYYYHGGDTSAFYYHSKVINQSLGDSVPKWFNLLFRTADPYSIDYYKYTNQMLWYNDQSAYMISGFTAFLGIFTFNTFLPTSVLFAALSFTGVWALFRTFAEQYPKLIKPLAIAILFIPSTFVWGSGIFKDTVCLAALGWMTFAAFRILIRQKFKWNYFFTLAFCFYLLTVIKVYIVLVFIPALTLWVLNNYAKKIRNSFLRFGLKLSVYLAIIVGVFYVSSNFAEQLGEYSLDKLAETSTSTRNYIYFVSVQTTTGEEGSAYNLGELDPTVTGMLSKFPLAVNVTLFRPYMWEARKPIIFLNSIESFLFLFFTLKLLFSVGLKGISKSVKRNSNIQFLLVFSVIFAFAVGISSYNFGALSRYRIPCLSFYALALMLIYYDHYDHKKSFFNLYNK